MQKFSWEWEGEQVSKAEAVREYKAHGCTEQDLITNLGDPQGPENARSVVVLVY